MQQLQENLVDAPTWYETNVDAGTNGAGAGNGAIRTDGDAQRAFTEDQLKGILVSCYNEGGNPNMIMVMLLTNRNYLALLVVLLDLMLLKIED